jgi:hypothetical protein
MTNSSILFFVSVGIFGAASDKEKRERYHALLPVSVKIMGKQRLLFVILYQICVFIFWLILYYMKLFDGNSEVIWSLISIIMFNLMIICLFVIYTDLGFYGIKFHKPIIALIIACSIFIYSITLMNINTYVFAELNFDTSLFFSYIHFIKLLFGAIVMTLLTGLFYAISYIIFIHRKSYLA